MTWKEISWPRRTDGQSGDLCDTRPSLDEAVDPIREENVGLENNNVLDIVDTHQTEDFLPDLDSFLQTANDFSSFLTWDPWSFGYN